MSDKGIKFVLGISGRGKARHSAVQSVLFPAGSWQPQAARRWLLDHKFIAPVADRTGGYLRYRQQLPSRFDSFRTVAAGAHNPSLFSKIKSALDKKQTSFSAKAVLDAWEAGKRGYHQGLGDFEGWLKNSSHREVAASFRKKLESEYWDGYKAQEKYEQAGGRGVSPAKHSKLDWLKSRRSGTAAAPAVATPPPPASAPRSTGRGTTGSRYRGYAIARISPDTWTVPKLDSGSEFESLADAKRFIDSQVALAKANGSKRKRSKKNNPEDTAADGYEHFHGAPSEHIDEYVEDVRYHEHLWVAGDLAQLRVATCNGLDAELNFAGYDPKQNDFDPGANAVDRPKLAFNEEGTQAYVIGGDQSLDLHSLKLDGDEWKKDLMVIGIAYEITYQTKKSFDKFRLTSYYHQLGEDSGVQPTLLYDTLNDRLEIAGGQYRISRKKVEGASEGIVN
ncbi:MAG: hypothetical protein U0Q18_25350 [Bryobacteraceae bacterium]